MIRRAGQLRKRVQSNIEQQMTDDLQWAAAAPEVRQHRGKLVAVHKRRVLGVGIHRDDVVEQAASRGGCPEEDIVVLVVPSGKLSETPR